MTNGLDQTGTKVGSVTLNMDPTNASTALANEAHNSVASPLVTAPLVTAPLVTASGYTSSTANPLVTAPLVTAASVDDALMTQDFSWNVAGGADIVNSAMTLQVAMKNINLSKFATSYKFELRISRRATHTGVGLCGTETSLGDEQIISSIPLDPVDPAFTDPAQSPLVTAPLVTAPLVTAPLVTAPLVTAATFSMAPPDTQTGANQDGTLYDTLNNSVNITLRAYAIVQKSNLPDLPTPSLTVQALSEEHRSRRPGRLQIRRQSHGGRDRQPRQQQHRAIPRDRRRGQRALGSGEQSTEALGGGDAQSRQEPAGRPPALCFQTGFAPRRASAKAGDVRVSGEGGPRHALSRAASAFAL